jgi:hypothetical protein
MATTADFVNAFTDKESPAPLKGMTFTENGALAHLGTGSKCLDFFTKVMARDKRTAMSDENIQQCMMEAWQECPALALRLVANLRDIRGDTGKGERHASEVCWKWLLEHHYPQIQANMIHIPFFGRWKDLLDICLGTPLETQMLQLYAEQLVRDLESYRLGFDSEDPLERSKYYGAVTLASKWAPTEKCAYDKEAKKANRPTPSFRLATILHGLIDAPDSCSRGTALMRWYRKQVLTPLREVIGIVERYLCAREFDKIDFSKVPGVALKIYSKKTFPNAKRPELATRFARWQQDVLSGKVKMNTGTVDPYEVVDLLYRGTASTDQIPTLEAFYQKQVEMLRAKLAERFGTAVPSSVFVIDTSGSMTWDGGIPIVVALSLGIWGSAIANPAWRDLFFTFETNPSVVNLTDCKTLQERIVRAAQASVGGSTDLQATLDLILHTAVDKGLSKEQMPNRLVIVSDMQFNEAVGHYGSVPEQLFTNLEVMRAKFRKAGYDMPIIVFWNVRGNVNPQSGAPATADDRGVIMVSGFSKSLLTLIMEGDEIPTPRDIMLKALSDERYDRLTVIDEN